MFRRSLVMDLVDRSMVLPSNSPSVRDRACSTWKQCIISNRLWIKYFYLRVCPHLPGAAQENDVGIVGGAEGAQGEQQSGHLVLLLFKILLSVAVELQHRRGVVRAPIVSNVQFLVRT